jgi:4-hydroxybutyrate dehydrogenase
MVSRFSFPTQIVFGPGAARDLGEVARGLGGTRALVVTDPGVRDAGLAARVTAPLTAGDVTCAVFDRVSPNPTEENVEEGIGVYRAEECDLLVGVGGGSAIDAAKAIRLRATHELPLVEYDDNFGGEAKIRGGMPPMIAIPTTAGTGSEVGRSTVIICRANARKTVIFSPHLMPSVAVCDPELTVGMPARITAATGMDALTHCVEAYLARPYHPLCDAIALHGMELCARSLRRAVEHGTDLAARGEMMIAAMMGATAFQKGLGVTHSLAHPLSSVAGMHHGTANAVLLPYVLAFNAPACPEKYAVIARTLQLDVPPHGSPAEAVVAWVRDLNAAVGIPATLSSFGVTAAMVPEMVPKALEDGCHQNNPRPCAAEEMRALYLAAL